MERQHSPEAAALIERGASIIVHNWIQLAPGERLLIVSDRKYEAEVMAIREAAFPISRNVHILMLDELSIHVGRYFDHRVNAFDAYDVIIGANEYSLITTQAVKYAISQGKRFLSLPLSTNDGRSMLEYDFLKMDTSQSKTMASILMPYLNKARRIRVTTDLGTDLTTCIEGRQAGFFNGCCRDGSGLSSASVEVYVAMQEDSTEGTLILDGSMGYIGTVSGPLPLTLKGGRITEIANTPDGKRLRNFVNRFDDSLEMLVAGEFGIGLNTHSRCLGNCYIEDESTYGTFHIGFGRNIALGGVHEASGHYDLVTHRPTIMVDNRIIMDHGVLL